MEHNQAVIYKGPFREVLDDDGHRLARGERIAVCDKTFDLYQGPAYKEHFAFVEPRIPVAPQDAQPFDCDRARRRHPRESKGAEYSASTDSAVSCTTSGCC